MKVKELIKQLQQLPQNDEIVITSMDDYFYETDFEIHSSYDDEQAQEIIINRYFNQRSLKMNTLKTLKKQLEWLATHNKNYTKKQYYAILECLELIDNIIGE